MNAHTGRSLGIAMRSSCLGLVLLAGVLSGVTVQALEAPVSALQSAVVQPLDTAQELAFDGVVEAVQSTILASQVAGAVIALQVKAGDSVQAGQPLLRIDARTADQLAAAGNAQVQAARAALELATRDVQRQRQLFGKNYISQAALDRAESMFRAAQAQLNAQVAQSEASRTQSDLYVVSAPYAGIVAEVPIELGDMAMPGRPLVVLHDPAMLRVSVAISPSVAARLDPAAAIKVQFPDLPSDQQWLAAEHIVVLPTLDPGSQSATLRLQLPSGTPHVRIGMFARVWLPAAAADGQRMVIPFSAVVRRAELTAVYVVDADGRRPLLRLVRLGAVRDEQVEVLTGLSPGERIALDPQAAARVR